MTLKLAVLYGSYRQSRQGIKAARYIITQLEKREHTVTLVDAKEKNLPMLDKMYNEYKGDAPAVMKELATLYQIVDAFVIVTGEYNHSVPPGLKNLLDHFMKEYFWKPSAIVCYSAGTYGGVRAAVHLRAVLAELGMPSIPSLFPIGKVQEFSDEGVPPEGFYDKKLPKFLNELEWYTNACKEQRKKGMPY